MSSLINLIIKVMKKNTSCDTSCDCGCGGDCNCGCGCGCGHHGRWPVWVKIIAILALCSIIIVAILRDKIVNNQYRSITALGQGRVSYVPDIATVNLGVQVDKAAKADEALAQLNDRIAKVLAAVKSLGVADENIITKNYSLVPQYDYKDNVSTIGGYNANQQLSIKIKDLKNNQDLLNKVVAEATKAGANQVLGIAFEASNIDEVKQEAKVKAIADAKGKAKSLAAAAGVELKDITGWYENFLKGGYYGDVSTDMGKGGYGGGGAAPQITTSGDNEVLVEIGVTYNIED
jgi:uncharacterized protein YggE